MTTSNRRVPRAVSAHRRRGVGLIVVRAFIEVASNASGMSPPAHGRRGCRPYRARRFPRSGPEYEFVLQAMPPPLLPPRLPRQVIQIVPYAPERVDAFMRSVDGDAGLIPVRRERSCSKSALEGVLSLGAAMLTPLCPAAGWCNLGVGHDLPRMSVVFEGLFCAWARCVRASGMIRYRSWLSTKRSGLAM